MSSENIIDQNISMKYENLEKIINQADLILKKLSLINIEKKTEGELKAELKKDKRQKKNQDKTRQIIKDVIFAIIIFISSII